MLDASLEMKWNHLLAILREMDGCVVAYSGGVDSSVLLEAVRRALGKRCLAVIGVSAGYPQRELQAAQAWVEARGIAHEVVETNELQDEHFRANPPERCYYCKQMLFKEIRKIADRHGLGVVAEGSNADDIRDFRPGRRAVLELGIRSPLLESGLEKKEIRLLAEAFQLPMAGKPAAACLASRFQYGTVLSREKLRQVEQMEDFLAQQGFRVYRARYHGDLVRLELGSGEEVRLAEPGQRQAVVAAAKGLGFRYVSLDLEGFRTGSANEGLDGRNGEGSPSEKSGQG